MNKIYKDQFKQFNDIRKEINLLSRSLGYDIVYNSFISLDGMDRHATYRKYERISRYNLEDFNAPFQCNKLNIKFMNKIHKKCLRFYKKELRYFERMWKEND